MVLYFSFLTELFLYQSDLSKVREDLEMVENNIFDLAWQILRHCRLVRMILSRRRDTILPMLVLNSY